MGINFSTISDRAFYRNVTKFDAATRVGSILFAIELSRIIKNCNCGAAVKDLSNSISLRL